MNWGKTMSKLNRNVTEDDIAIINTLCHGRGLDFTNQVIRRIPEFIEVANCIGWIEGVPSVPEEDYQSFNIALMREDDPSEIIVTTAVYLNKYEMNFEDAESIEDFQALGFNIGVEHDIHEDATQFYTGWAFQTMDTYEETYSFDFIHSDRVKAYKELPKFCYKAKANK